MVVLLDADIELPQQASAIYSWNGHIDANGIFSLFRYVETHSDRLRSKYLAFTYELGERYINGKRIIDHLTFKDGLSYWWFTPFVEKHLHVLPFVDAIRLFALEEILIQCRPREFLLISANRSLHQVIKGLCNGLAIKYKWNKQKGNALSWSRTRLYNSLPQSLRAILGLLRYVRTNKKFMDSARGEWFSHHSLFICGYFANLDTKMANSGTFYSRYWSDLLPLMRELEIRPNWLHHNVSDAYKDAMTWVSRFNENKENQGAHAFLAAYFSWSVIFRVIQKWIMLSILSFRLKGVRDAFSLQGSFLSLWPLMKSHWSDALCGSLAMSNLLSIELFEKALHDIPQQKLGLYLCENHAWERALIHAWRKYNHGQLIGVAHSTVRFWDLRYFFDSRMLVSLPQPDRIALNGIDAVDAYRRVHFPRGAIVECEALRYGYLSESSLSNRLVQMADEKHILILGDILFSATDRMLQMLVCAQKMQQNRLRFTLKSHPICPIDISRYPELELTVMYEPLELIMNKFDMAFASESTSAAVDAYCSGLSVTVLLDDKKLNFSPLRHRKNVNFVSTSEELSRCLQLAETYSNCSVSSNAFFFLDPQMPRWRKLLQSVISNTSLNEVH